MKSFLTSPLKVGPEPLTHRFKRTVGPIFKGAYSTSWFLRRSRNARERKMRNYLLRRFRQSTRDIPCEHQEREFLVIADYVLLTAPLGDLVECGCYRGGATIKLSILAAVTGRRLYVCDSFKGLPQTTAAEQRYVNVTGHSVGVRTGQYAATLIEVRQAVATHGEVGVCEFVPGLFRESLPSLNVSPALVFSDAKLIASTRDVVRNLWPRIVVGGRLWLHDTTIPEFVFAALDPDWWQGEISEPPPVLFGAGWGLGFGAENIAFAEKRTRRAATDELAV
jgi:hypothetical protein